MLDYLYEWILNLAYYMIMVTAVVHIIPNEGYRKYIRFFTGLVLILFILAPIFRLFGTEVKLSDVYKNSGWEEQMEKMEEIEESAYVREVLKEDAIRVDEIKIEH